MSRLHEMLTLGGEPTRTEPNWAGPLFCPAEQTNNLKIINQRLISQMVPPKAPPSHIHWVLMTIAKGITGFFFAFRTRCFLLSFLYKTKCRGLICKNKNSPAPGTSKSILHNTLDIYIYIYIYHIIHIICGVQSYLGDPREDTAARSQWRNGALVL
jgi:hypothetical protein